MPFGLITVAIPYYNYPFRRKPLNTLLQQPFLRFRLQVMQYVA